jgi:ankyrin repeat protein
MTEVNSMTVRFAVAIAGLLAAVLIGTGACGTSHTETTSTQQGNAAAQRAGAAAGPDTKGALILKAAEDGNQTQMKSLLKAGAPANYSNSSGVTPLMIAAGLGNTGIASALLDHGADASAKTPGGYTPLMSAALNGQKEVIRLVIERGADPSATDVSGRTAARYAQGQNRSEIVRLLASGGAK